MFGRSREQVENIREVGRHYGNTTMEVLRTAFETSLVLELSSTIATALVAVEVSLRLIAGDLPFDNALALLIITPEFFLPLRQLATRYHAGSTGRAAGERIFGILDRPAVVSLPGATVWSVPAGDLRLERVSFAYEGARPALYDVSIDIPRGRTVALVGETGSGKTTVANLLLRFFEPDRGRITIDGLPLGSWDVASWRSQVAWVPQRPTCLWHGRGEHPPGPPGRQPRRGAGRGGDSAPRRPPGSAACGLDTVIGERGMRLSGGEQQRVAIARALLKDAPILILDEATSHLDAESEALIRRAVSRLTAGRSVLLIAHRLSLAHEADSVVVLQDGRVIGAGDHQSLLANNLPYRRLVLDYESGTL
jgi:ATP-binding cassette subfamily C protein CydD